ncbi:haloacid dehalogenase, partial [Rhizobium leguminosarum]
MLSLVLEEPDNWAMFLDIDGTLLNLAPTPDAIEVPEALPGQLHRLSNKLGGAL